MSNSLGGEPVTRRFEKKWNEFIDDFCYRELGNKGANIMTPEDFMFLKLSSTDEIVVENDGVKPPDGYEIGSDGYAKRTW